MQDFKKLHVWQESVDLAAFLYESTESLPSAERYGLRAQLRSAAISVSSNIAEGCGRPTPGDLARFLGFAIGSACEIESQLHIARRLGLLADPVIDHLLRRVGRLRRRLIALHVRVTGRAKPENESVK